MPLKKCDCLFMQISISIEIYAVNTSCEAAINIQIPTGKTMIFYNSSFACRPQVSTDTRILYGYSTLGCCSFIYEFTRGFLPFGSNKNVKYQDILSTVELYPFSSICMASRRACKTSPEAPFIAILRTSILFEYDDIISSISARFSSLVAPVGADH